MTARLNWLIQVNHRDPERARRGQLLNILLLGTGLAVILGLMAAVTFGGILNLLLFAFSGLVTILLVGGLYVLNRLYSPPLAGFLFLVGLTAILALSDTPQQLVNGRSTVTLALPVIMASMILGPASSFLMALLVNAVLLVLAQRATTGLSPVTVLVFFLAALVSWLAARSIERALGDLRAINRELDQRVADRTQALSAEASQRQAILEGIADGVLVFNPTGQTLLANPAAAHLLRQPLTAILGRDLLTLMGSEVPPTERAVLQEALDARRRTEGSLRVGWGAKTLLVSLAPVEFAPGQPKGMVVVMRDFTREAEVEQLKSRIVAMVSHDLRTPLGSIIGFVGMLQDEARYGGLMGAQRDFVRRIHTNARRLRDMVQDLLDEAQLEAGVLTLRSTMFPLHDMVEGLHAAADPLAHDKHITFSVEVAPDMPARVEGDPQRLQQVLVNLTNNALKFTPAGGRVSVRLARQSQAHWLMEVADTGPGIPAEAQEHIFEPFWQVANDPSTRSHGGVGLGLAIVEQLVTRMGGTIEVASTAGHGSVFTARLPFRLATGDTS